MKKSKENSRFLRPWLLIIFLLIGAPNCINAQIFGSPFIENYNARQYQASVSNFDIHLDKFGRLYFANWNTLLRFDGHDWQSISIADGKSAYELSAINNGRIYVSTATEIGYIYLDEKGEERYQPLEDSLVMSQDILELKAVGNNLYIFTPTHLLLYNSTDGVKQAGSKGSIIYKGEFGPEYENAFVSGGNIYINIVGVGLCFLQNDELVPVKNGTLLSNEVIASSAKVKSGQILLCKSGNVYFFDRVNGLSEFSFSKKIKTNVGNCGPKSLEAKQVGDNISIAVGTQKDGIYYFKNGELLYHINKLNGLANNEVRDLRFVGNTLWATTQNGISKLSGLESFKYWKTEDKEIGLIWELFKHKNSLYLATTEGLFQKRGNQINRVGTLKERSYYLYAIGDELYLNNKLGIYKVKGDELKLLHALNSPNQTLQVDKQLFIMSNEGLFVSEIIGGEIQKPQFISKKASGQSFSSAIYDGAIWLSVVNHGILRVEKENGKYKCNLLTSKYGLPDDTSIEIVKFKNELLFATNKGFYRLNNSSKGLNSNYFIYDSAYSNLGEEISFPRTDNNGNLWFVASKKGASDRLKKLEVNDSNNINIISKPYRLLNDQALTIVYPDPQDKSTIWIGGSRGLYRYKESNDVSHGTKFHTIINKVINNDAVIFRGLYKNNEEKTSLEPWVDSVVNIDFQKNNLAFQYTATTYEAPNYTQYNFKLNGFDENWSGWTNVRTKEYTNLDPGDYEFLVKSKDVYGNESEISIFKFHILTPWYLKNWAIVGYILIAVIFVFLIIEFNTRRLKDQKLKLRQVISDTTEELRLQKEQIELKNRQLHEYNDQLKVNRDEILTQNEALEKQQAQISNQNKELKEVNATKDKFFSIIGHDLKSPLNSLTSFANLLQNHVDKMTKDEIKQLAGDFNRSIRNSQNLLDNLLNWARSQTDQVTMYYENFDLEETLKTNRELLAQQAALKGISINDQGIRPAQVWADKNSVNTVIRNLITNAIKFTPEGGYIELTITESDDYIITSIEDNGVGLPKDVLGNLFRLDAKHVTSGTNKETGTGLGLILCKEFVEKNHGTIWVKSELGKGSVFSFSLPKDKPNS